jgi:hypothetical protein
MFSARKIIFEAQPAVGNDSASLFIIPQSEVGKTKGDQAELSTYPQPPQKKKKQKKDYDDGDSGI